MGVLSLEIAGLYEHNTNPISGSRLGPNVDRESSLIRTVSVTGRYPVSPRLSLLLSVPYRTIRSPKDVGGSAAKHIDRHFEGLGDSILLGRYQVNGGAGGSSAPLHVLAGLRLPTGPANPNHTWRAADGTMILSRDPVLQPGFGTFDPIVGLQWSKPLSNGRNLYLSTLYRQTGGRNSYGYRYGNEFQATLGASLPVGRDVTFSPQLFAQFSAHDFDFRPLPGKHAGQVSNTGGQWLYFMPNVRVGSLEFDIQIPIYRKTNGNILNPKVILGVRTTTDVSLSRAAREKRLLREAGIAPRHGDFRVVSRGEVVDLAACAAPGKITLLEFASRHCGTCRSLTPTLEALLQRRPDLALRQIDVTDPTAPALTEYGVEATPSFLVIGRDGERVNPEPLGWEEVKSWLEQQEEADHAELGRTVPVCSRGEALDLTEHLAAGKVTVFQFFSPDCAACRTVSPAMRHLQESDPEVVFRRIDVGGGGEAVERYRIETTPTFLVFSEDGRLVGRTESPDVRRLSKLIRKAKQTPTR